MSEPTEQEKAENRALAADVIGVMQTAHLTLTGLSVEMAKWIQTSLLAINGAAAIATFPVQIPVAFKVTACATFIGGVLLALLGGFLQIRILGRMSNRLGEALGYWVSVKFDGWRIEEIEAGHNLEQVEKKGMILPQVVGWASVLVNRRAKLTPYRRPILTPSLGSAAVIPVVDRRGPRTTTRTVRCAGGGVRGRSLLTHRVNRRGWGSGGRGFGLSSGF